jgi:hypothetical protein
MNIDDIHHNYIYIYTSYLYIYIYILYLRYLQHSWLVVSNMFFYFRFHIWDVILHWLTHMFQDGYCTTNQMLFMSFFQCVKKHIVFISQDGFRYEVLGSDWPSWWTGPKFDHSWEKNCLHFASILNLYIWLVVWNMAFVTFPSYWEFTHPNWRTPHIFRRGRYATNQI